MDFTATLIGFGVGAIVGMTGVGGGSLMTPLLLSVFKLNPALAIGTDLWFAAVTKFAGATSHHRAGHVDWRITTLLLAGSVPGALGTIAAMHATGLTLAWSGALTFSLGIALLLTAIVVAFRGTWQAVGLRLERWLPASHRRPSAQYPSGLRPGGRKRRDHRVVPSAPLRHLLGGRPIGPWSHGGQRVLRPLHPQDLGGRPQ